MSYLFSLVRSLHVSKQMGRSPSARQTGTPVGTVQPSCWGVDLSFPGDSTPVPSSVGGGSSNSLRGSHGNIASQC